jgi:trimeric autotransporter adhesin
MMTKNFKLVFLSLFGIMFVSTLSAFAQQGGGGGGTGGGSSVPAGSVIPTIVQSGLLAQYDFNEGSGTTLTDVSTNGNNGTFCGSAPTWNTIASGGGVAFLASSSQCITVPSALNAAKTIQMFAYYEPINYATTPFYTAAIVGNGGTVASTAGLAFEESGGPPGFANSTNGSISALLFADTPSVSTQAFVTSPLGTNAITWLLDAAQDVVYVNSQKLPCASLNCSGGHTGGNQTSGVYQFGGRGAGWVNGNSSFWTGTIYYALFYNRELNFNEINQNVQAMTSIMALRGIYVKNQTNLTGNIVTSTGDSEDVAANGYFKYMTPTSSVAGAWNGVYLSQSGGAPLQSLGNEPVTSAPWVAPQGLAIDHLYLGANALGGAGFISQYGALSRTLKLQGYKIIIFSNMDATAGGGDSGKNTNNTAIRNQWTFISDAFADVGADPQMGCNGCASNTTYFSDGLHPTDVGQSKIGAIAQRALNHLIGNNDFSAATTYTATAAAATATTAGSESTNTVTLTFSVNPFPQGSWVYCTGMTPSGYNSLAGYGPYWVITSSGTQITYTAPTAGMGVVTVQGSCSSPSEQDVDTYSILAGAAASPVWTLNTCLGYTGQNLYIKNANTTSPWVITPTNGETIDGSTALTMPAASTGNKPVLVLQSVLTSTTTGGCSWQRVQ